MSKSNVTASVFILLTAFFASTANAYCPFGHRSVEQEYEASFYVVSVKAISEKDVPESQANDFIGGTNYDVQVEEIYKGSPPHVLTLYSENSSGRFPLDKGKDYLLFIDNGPNTLDVDNCGNSGLLEKSDTALAMVRKISRKQ